MRILALNFTEKGVGTYLRAFYFCRELARAEHKVTLATVSRTSRFRPAISYKRDWIGEFSEPRGAGPWIRLMEGPAWGNRFLARARAGVRWTSGGGRANWRPVTTTLSSALNISPMFPGRCISRSEENSMRFIRTGATGSAAARTGSADGRLRTASIHTSKRRFASARRASA